LPTTLLTWLIWRSARTFLLHLHKILLQSCCKNE
jgi:hypothetical protein